MPPRKFSARGFARSVRWKVEDIDYWADLTPEQQVWYRGMLECEIGADFRHDTEGRYSPELRREVYQAKNAANRDYYEIGRVNGLTSSLDEMLEHFDMREAKRQSEGRHSSSLRSPPIASPSDPAPAPEYLESPAYKAARDSFRQHVVPGLSKANRPNPKSLPARRASQQLQEQIEHGQRQDSPDPIAELGADDRGAQVREWLASQSRRSRYGHS